MKFTKLLGLIPLTFIAPSPAHTVETQTPEQRILNAAADLLEAKGWCRSYLRDNYGRHCMVGAIITARTNGNFQPIEGIRAVRIMDNHILWPILGHLRVGPQGIIGWNDGYCKNSAQAVATLRAAAKKLN